MNIRIGGSKPSAFHSSGLPIDLRGFSFKDEKDVIQPARKYFDGVRADLRGIDSMLQAGVAPAALVGIRRALVQDYVSHADQLTRRSYHGWRMGFQVLLSSVMPEAQSRGQRTDAQPNSFYVSGSTVEQVSKKLALVFLSRPLRSKVETRQGPQIKLPISDGLEVIPKIFVLDTKLLLSGLSVADRSLFFECYEKAAQPFQFVLRKPQALVQDPSKCRRIFALIQRLSGTDFAEIALTLERFGTLPLSLGQWKLTGREGRWDAYAQMGVSGTAYGSYQWQIQQLVGYQEGIEAGSIRRATVELRGSLNVDAFGEIFGEGLERPGAVPDIEFVYKLTLPSGKPYYLLLRGVAGFSQRPENSDQAYSDQDRELVSALRRYLDQIDHRRTLEIFAAPSEREVSELPALRASSRSDYSFEALENVDQSWCNLIAARLARAKSTPEEVPLELDWRRPEFSDSSHFEKIVRSRLPLLRTEYPLKNSERYNLNTEEVELFIARYLPVLFDKCASERRRIAETSASDELAQGYEGPLGGIPIRLDFLLMDKIVNFKTGKRDYADRKGILPLADLPELLKKTLQSRKIQIIVDKPTLGSGETSREVWLDPAKVEQFYKEMVATACKVMKPVVLAWKKSVDDDLRHNQIDRQEHLTAQVCWHVVTKLYREISANQQRLKHLSSEKDNKLRQAAARNYIKGARHRELVGIKASYEAQIEKVLDSIWRCQGNILEIFNSMFPGIVNAYCELPRTVIDHNYVKLIYTVLPKGEILISEEKATVQGVSRPTHSQHSSGGCMWLGGELFFADHKFCYNSIGEWIDSYKLSGSASNGGGVFKCWEANNASGHGRPPPSTLALVDCLIKPQLAAMGIDVSQMRVVDRLVPGMRLPSLENF